MAAKMITWTKNSLYKRKQHWVSKEDVERCLNQGKKIKTERKRTDQTDTWLASHENIRVRYIEDEEKVTIIDLYKK